ncbi:FAD/NAD(P)-binding domain-containing protein [Colletotrichum somersetense]|nr:FAD/NAD(P)-binding domain-containing protein [Colletotrichum somersetense]
MQQLDCVVVGAGLYGLGAAKQYRCTNPRSSLAILDAQSDLGGNWASQRLYSGLKSNNLYGTYQYPDFPMDTEKFGIKFGEHIPGNIINAYFHAYCVEFGIKNLIRLNSKVLAAEHQDELEGGWVLTILGPDGKYKLSARRLIVAAGHLSEAFLPHFAGQETFGGKIFHGKDFLQHADTIRDVNSVTVFGASKSSWDAVYQYATSGVKVNWIIRASGHGPTWNSPPYVTPLRRWIEELANTRFLTWFSACPWGNRDGYSGIRNFLHGTAIGRIITKAFWNAIGNDVIQQNGYDSHPKTAKLKPWIPAMNVGTSWGLFNYPTDHWEVIKGDNVDVHIRDFDHLSPGKVHFTDGTELKADVLFAHMGWKRLPTIKFLPEGIEGELGIPHFPSEHSSVDNLASQKSLRAQVEEEILQTFPILRNKPVWNEKYQPLTEHEGIDAQGELTPYTPLEPWMLYQFMVPATKRFLRTKDIAFVGLADNFSNPINAHIQGLWISAYFSGRLASSAMAVAAEAADENALSALQHDAMFHNLFGKWRYPIDWGHKTPSFIFDAVPYFDMLLQDLGVKNHRKSGFWSEIWSPYRPGDYKNVNEEWERSLQ